MNKAEKARELTKTAVTAQLLVKKPLEKDKPSAEKERLDNLKREAKKIYPEIIEKIEKAAKSDKKNRKYYCHLIGTYWITRDETSLANFVCKMLRRDGFKSKPRIMKVNRAGDWYPSLVIDISW
ncbi:MAG: hypothetical protein Q8Q46_03440 [Candidatus Giovannonibacteria bacterium]|nr:hypothetical protein [Candidatus Giovannonibacteria bacterium]